METAALMRARDHAKAAHTASQNADTTVAIGEYTLAAGEFSKAAQETTSHEAARLLKLLEEENIQLSNFLRTRVNKPIPTITLTSINEDVEEAKPVIKAQEVRATRNDATLKSHPQRVRQSTSIFVPPRAHNRELSSSIASGLASARGIRSSHDRRALSPSVTTQVAPGDLQTSPRRTQSSSTGPGIPPPIVGKRESHTPSISKVTRTKAEKIKSQARPSESVVPSKEDEGFATWSSTFGNILSRLSAPLAFAGLPLTIDEDETETKSKAGPSSKPQDHSMADAQDMTRLFSKNALTSIQYLSPSKVQESFYHVPTTGHTASYANILLYDEKERHRNMAASIYSQSAKEDDEDFHEAYERIPNPDQTLLKDCRISSKKTAEVLELENKFLKESLDTASKRLAAFENASQSSTMIAMQESIRFQRPISPQRNQFLFGSKMSEETAEKRLRALSSRYEGLENEVERLKKENAKLGGYIQRYRDKFESMKQTARRQMSGGVPEAKGDTDRGRYLAG